MCSGIFLRGDENVLKLIMMIDGGITVNIPKTIEL